MPDLTPLIAIVDDDPSVRRALGRLLRSFGLRAETFDSGEEFLRGLASSNRPDCVVMDVQMPVMSGLEVQQRLARERIRLPLVFVTAFEEASVTERAIAAGAIGFLRKPFTDRSLIDLIRRALPEASKVGDERSP